MTQSFQRVSTQLEQVHQGLEMRGLTRGVGDLKKVLSARWERGIVGEISRRNSQSILSQSSMKKMLLLFLALLSVLVAG